ncbi:hypothetical protein EDB84DRAFT_1442589 [Lactarius hengduanensis]|nr:hypothetical protein EDB84DRAFT_1442589 [Lactarius hengduanensis]
MPYAETKPTSYSRAQALFWRRHGRARSLLAVVGRATMVDASPLQRLRSQPQAILAPRVPDLDPDRHATTGALRRRKTGVYAVRQTTVMWMRRPIQGDDRDHVNSEAMTKVTAMTKDQGSDCNDDADGLAAKT